MRLSGVRGSISASYLEIQQRKKEIKSLSPLSLSQSLAPTRYRGGAAQVQNTNKNSKLNKSSAVPIGPSPFLASKKVKPLSTQKVSVRGSSLNSRNKIFIKKAPYEPWSAKATYPLHASERYKKLIRSIKRTKKFNNPIGYADMVLNPLKFSAATPAELYKRHGLDGATYLQPAAGFIKSFYTKTLLTFRQSQDTRARASDFYFKQSRNNSSKMWRSNRSTVKSPSAREVSKRKVHPLVGLNKKSLSLPYPTFKKSRLPSPMPGLACLRSASGKGKSKRRGLGLLDGGAKKAGRYLEMSLLSKFIKFRNSKIFSKLYPKNIMGLPITKKEYYFLRFGKLITSKGDFNYKLINY